MTNPEIGDLVRDAILTMETTHKGCISVRSYVQRANIENVEFYNPVKHHEWDHGQVCRHCDSYRTFFPTTFHPSDRLLTVQLKRELGT